MSTKNKRVTFLAGTVLLSFSVSSMAGLPLVVECQMTPVLSCTLPNPQPQSTLALVTPQASSSAPSSSLTNSSQAIGAPALPRYAPLIDPAALEIKKRTLNDFHVFRY